VHRGDFFSGLRSVAAIGEKAGIAARDSDGAAGAGESAEIANVGEMSNEKTGNAGARKPAAQRAHAARIVHGERIKQRSGVSGQ
jgi:hypothetical protein